MCIFQVSSAKVNMLHGKSNGSLTSQPRMVRIFPLLALNRNNAVPLFIEIYLLAFVIRSLFRLGLDEFEHVASSNASGYTHTQSNALRRSFTCSFRLQQSNRVTMKLDVSYTDHSHIIGKGGLTIKRVMEETGCHIHFPDSNRSNHQEKSNQVSIAGEMEGVERARARVRVKKRDFIFDFIFLRYVE